MACAEAQYLSPHKQDRRLAPPQRKRGRCLAETKKVRCRKRGENRSGNAIDIKIKLLQPGFFQKFFIPFWQTTTILLLPWQISTISTALNC